VTAHHGYRKTGQKSCQQYHLRRSRHAPSVATATGGVNKTEHEYKIIFDLLSGYSKRGILCICILFKDIVKCEYYMHIAHSIFILCLLATATKVPDSLAEIG